MANKNKVKIKAQEKLEEIVKKSKSLLCVGLDTDLQRLPKIFDDTKYPLFYFNKDIIDATCDLVSSYKINTAFYEALGKDGIYQLKLTCEYVNKRCPDIFLILDAKRGDIGNTNNGYVSFAYDYLNVDAITLHPYLGREALDPFLDREDKMSIILCLTSNSGASEFQSISSDGKLLYEIVAEKVKSSWNKNNNCMLVVGATRPTEMANLRKIAGENMWFLVPGIGAQGGDIRDVMSAGTNEEKSGLIISASRSIIFASSDDDFLEKARFEAKKLFNDINNFRKQVIIT